MKLYHIYMIPLPQHGFPKGGVLSLDYLNALELAFRYDAIEILYQEVRP